MVIARRDPSHLFDFGTRRVAELEVRTGLLHIFQPLLARKVSAVETRLNRPSSQTIRLLYVACPTGHENITVEANE